MTCTHGILYVKISYMILTEQQPQDNLALKYTTQTIKLENEKPVFFGRLGTLRSSQVAED